MEGGVSIGTKKNGKAHVRHECVVRMLTEGGGCIYLVGVEY